MRLGLLLPALLLPGCGKPASEVPPPAPATTSINLFEDITTQSGVTFVHATGTNFFMPDSLGSGVALLDFDRDGHLDIYFVQNDNSTPNTLFRQEQPGRFKDVSKGSGLDVAGRGMGAIAGDMNNDGWPDVVVTEYGATRLFANREGHFVEVTRESTVDNPRWAAPASFIDFDRDGWLDLVVANYVDYDPTQVCRDPQGRQDFCAPAGFPPTVTRLWRNVTGRPGETPKFEDWTVQSGIHRYPGMALGLVCADFTGDHWPDIFCSDDGRPNRLFVNQRNGTFTEEAARRGLGYDAMGRTAANMGVVYADLSGQGRGDLFITHLTEEFHALFRQDMPGIFMDVVAQSGLPQQGWRGTGFGAVAADFDLDGTCDLVFVNGLIRRGPAAQQPVLSGTASWWDAYAQRPQIFLKVGDRFVDRSSEQSTLCGTGAVGRSLALGDLDKDGSPDLVIGNIAGPARILRSRPAGKGRWLKIRLEEPTLGGRDAIGAEVRLRAGTRQWWAVLQPATSYLSSHEPALYFGLGDVTKIDEAEVVWPTGETERVTIPGLDREITFRRSAAQ